MYTSEQAASDAFRIDVSVETLDDITCRISHLPNQLRHLASLPAHSLTYLDLPFRPQHQFVGWCPQSQYVLHRLNSASWSSHSQKLYVS